MPFSDMLFSNSHSVEELVDIKKQKRVDKVLLKVIRTVRSRGNISGWVKPESEFKTDLKLTDKVIAGIKKTLGDYYNLDLMSNSSLNSSKAIVTYIKTNKPNMADSIYLIDSDQTDVDTNNEVQLDNDMADPNAVLLPQEEPRPETIQENVPEQPIPHQEITPNNEPIMDNPTDELTPSPDEVENSEPDTPVTPQEEIAEEPAVQPATEALRSEKPYTGKTVWLVADAQLLKSKTIKFGGGTPVYPTVEALIKKEVANPKAKHFVQPIALGVSFNVISKSLKKVNKEVVINLPEDKYITVDTAKCIKHDLPTVKIAKEGLEVSAEGLSVKPTEAKSWADVMNNL